MKLRKLHRDKAPTFKQLKSLSLHAPERFLADNGIPIFLFPLYDQEITKIDFIIKAGEYASDFSLTALTTLAMLQEGSTTMESEQIAERLDFLGSYLSFHTTKDRSLISVCCLEKHLAETIKIVTDFIIHPTFPEDKLETSLLKRKERFKVDNERVEVLSQKKLAQVLFGEKHPYGRTIQLDDFEHITRDDLIRFHNQNYVAENTSIVICGNPKSQEIKNLISFLQHNEFNTLNNKTQPIEYDIVSNTQKKHWITKENAVQSSLNLGKIMVNRNHPDFIPLQILNTILGGYFGSRLMTNIREDKGYTYGIGSGIISMEHAGYFIITSRVGKDVAQKALDAISDELRRLRTEMVQQDELDMVKAYMQSTLVRNFDGAFATSEMFRNTLGYDIDFVGYYQHIWSKIRKITAKELLELSNKYLHEDSMYEIVVG
jgi:predicted Zn-dependent peptidase